MSAFRPAFQPAFQPAFRPPFGASSTAVTRAQVIAALYGNGEQGGLWDPSDDAACFQDEAMTIPASADDPVRAVLDVSGEGNHLIAPSAAQRWIRETDGTYWWLKADGIDDLYLSDLLIGNRNEVSLFIAATQTSAPGYLVWNGGGASFSDHGLSLASGVGGGIRFSIGGSDTQTAAIAASQTFIFCVFGNKTAGTGFYDLNGSEVSFSPGIKSTTEILRVGDRSGGGAPRYSGRLYAMATRAAESSSAEVALVKQWLASKRPPNP